MQMYNSIITGGYDGPCTRGFVTPIGLFPRTLMSFSPSVAELQWSSSSTRTLPGCADLCKKRQVWGLHSPQTVSCSRPSVSCPCARIDFFIPRRSEEMAAPAVARPVGFNLDPVARDVPLLSQGPDGVTQDIHSLRRSERLLVVGHRGCGKNNPLSIGDTPDSRLSVRENTIRSFNLAGSNGADYVEFDVQVTKDDHPVIFHDDLLLSDDKSFAIRDLTLDEFLSFGPQKEQGKAGKKLLRKEDGSVALWSATIEDSLCTLREAFENVHTALGFNIELKFHDTQETTVDDMRRSIAAILSVCSLDHSACVFNQDVTKYSAGRKIYFSTFHPDAAIMLRREQASYPVFFLTCGGVHVRSDERRNSIEAAIALSVENGLQGIVTDVLPILKKPELAAKVKEAGLCLLTYGDHNNLAEALAQQYMSGVDGIIVDCVREMVTASRTVHALLNFVQPDWSQWTKPALV